MSQELSLTSRHSPKTGHGWRMEEPKKSKSCLSPGQSWACDVQGRRHPNLPVCGLCLAVASLTETVSPRSLHPF